MGLIRKALIAATGIGPLERTVNRLQAEVHTRAMQGNPEFVVSFTRDDIGVRNSLDVAIPVIVDRIQGAGHSVVTVDTPAGDWSSIVNMRVRPRDLRPASEHPVAPVDSVINPEVTVLTELRQRWALREMVGHPFGPALGLEEAIKLARSYFTGPDRWRLSSSGSLRIVGFDVLLDNRVTLEDWDKVLGYDRKVFHRCGLSTTQLATCVRAVSQIKILLPQYRQKSGDLFQYWQSDDEFALATFVWLTIINDRLGQIGLTDLLDYS